ncbi:MAG TPA: hypothetical protein VFW96_09900, partial [Thermomicrobiales bacterium]|nr:hypothetical protein [Thermomicrobiales bacterium]
MAAHPEPAQYLVAADDQPLIAIPFEEDGRVVVRYFVDEAAADAATSDDVTEAALAMIGAWSDLDWDDMERELYRIGHENPPTPPID